MWKNPKLFYCLGENKETTLTLQTRKKILLSPIINIKQALDVSPCASDSCYLGALVGWLSVFGNHKHLYGNQIINLVQNPYVY